MKNIPYPKIALFLLCLLTAAESLFASPDEFAVSHISADLKQDAEAVIRLETLDFTVHSIKKATMKVRQVITVVKPEGRDFGRLVLYYSKFTKITSLKGRLLDANGKQIRKLKKKEIDDYAVSDHSILYDDSRAQVAELYHSDYPYTIEFEYEIKYDGYLSWPAWYPQISTRASVQQSRFTIRSPNSLPIRYRAYKLDHAFTNASTSSEQILTWEATELPVIETEPYAPPLQEQVPCVLTAPTAFEIGGHQGDTSSWNGLGMWRYRLYMGRDILPVESRQKVKELVSGISSHVEKVRRIYNYLQETTRYIAVEDGISGWQPYEAAHVVENGYGDCKALSNYMTAMLKEANIPAFPVAINSGTRKPDVVSDFPRNQFNHIIVMVPTVSDTVWLECTNQNMPFDHLGADNEDRNVLVFGPMGGKLVRTPKSEAQDNQQVRTATVRLAANGDALTTITTEFTGNQQDRVRQTLVHATVLEREKWLRRGFEGANIEVLSADYSDVENKSNSLKLGCDLKLPRYAVTSGKRMFFKPNLMERWSYIPDEVKERKQPVRLNYRYRDTDTIDFEVPAGYKIEALPSAVALEEPFGSFNVETVVGENGVIRCVRTLEVNETRMPAEMYARYRAFIKQIVKADRAQVVLVKTP